MSSEVNVYKLKITAPSNAPRKNITRIIKIRGNESLESLQEEILTAYEREWGHLYEFYISDDPARRKKSRIPGSVEFKYRKYEDPRCSGSAKDAYNTEIDELSLEKGDYIFFLYDFGAMIYHKIKVMDIE